MKGIRDEVSPDDLKETMEIQQAIRSSFDKWEVQPSIRVMALFSLLIETFGWVDWAGDEEARSKVRRDLHRMAARLTELARTEPGTMRMQQVRSADHVGSVPRVQ